MPTIEFVGDSAVDGTVRPVNTSRLINLYREPVAEGGRARYILRPVPARVVVTDLGGAFLRALTWADNKVFAARGGILYEIAQSGVVAALGTIADCDNTDMAGNGGQMAVTCDGKYYLWNGDTVSQVSGGAFTNMGSVETVAGYTLVTERSGRRFQWSDLADPSTFPALNFATTETRDDFNVRGMAVAGQYWVFKNRSIEKYYPTGQSGAEAFAAVQGVTDHGLRAFNLICKAREARFYVASDGTVKITQGETPRIVSSRGVETAIANGNPTHCFYYEQYGHKFCVVRFADRPAWVLDLATLEWHERAIGAQFRPWDAIDCVEATKGVFWTGDRDSTISRLSDIVVDQGEPLYRRAVSRTLHLDSQRFRVAELEFFGAYGYAPATSGTDATYRMDEDSSLEVGGTEYLLDDAADTEPKLMVSLSGDTGATYGAERFLPMGLQGQYGKRTSSRAWGQFRQVTARLDMTHRFNIPIYADTRVRTA